VLWTSISLPSSPYFPVIYPHLPPGPLRTIEEKNVLPQSSVLKTLTHLKLNLQCQTVFCCAPIALLWAMTEQQKEKCVGQSSYLQLADCAGQKSTMTPGLTASVIPSPHLVFASDW
jgi:hypothetical protein